MNGIIRPLALMLALAAVILAGGCQNQKSPESAGRDLSGTWIQSSPGGPDEGEQIITIADGQGTIQLVFFDDPDDDTDDELAAATIIFDLKVARQTQDSLFVDVTLRGEGPQTSRLEYKFKSDDLVECIYEEELVILKRKK